MRAVVLAAGWARRLGNLCARQAKGLLPVGDSVPLTCVVEALAGAGVGAIDVLANARFLADVERWAQGRGVRVLSNGVRQATDQRGAVADLAAYLAAHPGADPLLVLGGDMLFDGSLEALVRAEPGVLAIAVHDVGDPARVRQLASVQLDAAGRVLRFVEKDPAPTHSLAAPAMFRIPADALAEIPEYLESGGPPDNLGHLIAWWVARRRVLGVPLPGRWIDVGTPEEYARACREFSGTG